ncbi:MAG: AmmeMemoRadiSam system protein B [Candidatus Omnitrophica bacterium]|nr:AmmeMemoRadiSam system protein B [Candidatus Omnitrophota bacterium]
MKKSPVLTILFFFLLSTNCFAQQIKKPVVSGAFYPDSAKILAAEIKRFLDWAEVGKKDKDVLALISPHAGYEYCGSVAAYGYKAIKDRPIRTVVIIGPSHYEYFDGVSVYPQGAWQTPLGNVPVDAELANTLINSHANISFYESAFAREHSVEVQIPFLQIVLDNFKIVPVIMGKFSDENCRILSQALLEATKDREDVLIVASTDMSHDHPYDEARKIDNLTIKELERLDPESLYYKLVSEECELCGAACVITTLLYAKGRGADDIEIMKYANSGDITGDKRRVVGYLSAAIYAPLRQGYGGLSSEAQALGDAKRGREEMSNENKDILNEGQQKRLLEIARKTMNEYVSSAQKLDFSESDPLLLKNMGAFVTIHKQGNLRGCIGNIIGRQPLYLTVRDMAIEAATADPRFAPVTADELEDIDIEISVLSTPERVEDVDEIKLGVHGVIVKRGNSGGVFLPQVATETGWTREEFLDNLCAHKAGLSADAWKDKDTELHSFTAQVFGEKDNR